MTVEYSDKACTRNTRKGKLESIGKFHSHSPTEKDHSHTQTSSEMAAYILLNYKIAASLIFSDLVQHSQMPNTFHMQ